jgi:hypothetical protein
VPPSLTDPLWSRNLVGLLDNSGKTVGSSYFPADIVLPHDAKVNVLVGAIGDNVWPSTLSPQYSLLGVPTPQPLWLG